MGNSSPVVPMGQTLDQLLMSEVSDPRTKDRFLVVDDVPERANPSLTDNDEEH